MKATQDTEGKSQLDVNLGQVKAPQAWAAGHTGKDTRVAVLDTGVDPTHPDLAGKIVEKADFTVEGGDAVDHFGHGTHVAATIAGSGAGSGGTRRGVAPDAQLVIGKVLDDEGSGSELRRDRRHGVGGHPRQGREHEPRRRPQRRHGPAVAGD